MQIFIMDMFLVGVGIILSTAFLASIIHFVASALFRRNSKDSFKNMSNTLQKNWRGISGQSKSKP
ncbi:hypothetical protein GLW08_05590 [Pontibacillus yanchengensis]|uniref:Uncharacterized protein n=2 Tax=Pontibacillus yanchengensis TaxID=462910 RepID=A0ACC7VCW1_9BACI|nr:hypothetical protein [Pontibacillus yanchengensis]MYL32228.1 hypothetical protein [Pontibacillus yanchengensis]MYL52808.1 hypothetical protein [Pontibacillus yanchengensis]